MPTKRSNRFEALPQSSRDPLETGDMGVIASKDSSNWPLVIAPAKERLEYDISIPVAKLGLRYELLNLSELNIESLDAIYDRDELDRQTRAKLRGEFEMDEFETSPRQIAAQLLHSREIVSSLTETVCRGCGLTNCFAELYRFVSNYVKRRCFGRVVDLNDYWVCFRLSDAAIQEGVSKYLVGVIDNLITEKFSIRPRVMGLRLSEMDPFIWDKDLSPLVLKKTIFNYVAVYNRFEEKFARFLDNAEDVKCFASLGFTDKGRDGASFSVDFVRPDGTIGLLFPDWIAVQDTVEGEVNWILGTKIEEVDYGSEIDSTVRDWCRRVSRDSGVSWKYFRVDQAEFRPEWKTLRELVVRLVNRAMARDRKRRGTTMSHVEIRAARDEGRA